MKTITTSKWPRWLAYLAYSIFEDLPEDEAMRFWSDLLDMTPDGVDLEPVRTRFLMAMQRRALTRLEGKPNAKHCCKAIQTVIGFLELPCPYPHEVAAVRAKARRASNSAWPAKSVAWAAKSARAAAHQASRSDRSVAWSARAAVWSTGTPLAERQSQRDDLLNLIRGKS